MKIEDIKKVFECELNLVNSFIIESLRSNVELINNIGNYVVLYGGKRIRPLVTILFSKIFSCDEFKSISMASVIELIHTATLLHDDVVDLSDKRRGKVTVNKLWGNKEAILVGDFLYTRSFQMMVNVDNFDILKLMADTTNIMSEGEVYQLVNRGNFNITESDCLTIAKCKTAQLFSAASSSCAILAGVDSETQTAVTNYGLYLGMAYQLVDDILDYSTDDVRFGKNIGIDLVNSTFTLPLVYFMSNDAIKKKFLVEKLSGTVDFNDLMDIRKLVIDSKSINYVFECAMNYANLAKKSISNIPESKYTDLAVALVDFIVSRKY